MAELGRREVSVNINGPDDQTPNPSSPDRRSGLGTRGWSDASYNFSRDVTKHAAEERQIGADSPPLSQSSPPYHRKNAGYPFLSHASSREGRVSFAEGGSGEATVKRRVAASRGTSGEVMLCSSNSSFQRRKPSPMMKRMKSRLIDRQPSSHTPARSGMLGKANEFDEDDPFQDGDLPEEYRKVNLSKLFMFQLISLILIVSALSSTLAIARFRRKSYFELALWKWELMVLVLISGRLVSGWFIRLVVFFIERNFLLRKRVLYFVYGVRGAVQSCVWLALVLISWYFIFDKKVRRITSAELLNTVTRIWVALLVSTVIWLLKTVLTKVLASSFHVKTFFDRIQESLFNQYVIETLSGPPIVEMELEDEEDERIMGELEKFQNNGDSLPPGLRANIFSRNEKVIGRRSPIGGGRSPRFSSSARNTIDEESIPIAHLHRLNQKNVSAWNMKRLMNTVRKGMLSTLDEQFHAASGHYEAAVEITSECQAKAAAKKIFYNVASQGSKRIYLEDLMRFLREDEACKAINLFEGSSDGKGISKRALKTWVVNAFRERRALALSLSDTKTAVNKLHQMLNVAVAILILVISTLILKITSTHFFIVLGSQLILVVFMFGNTCKTTFESIIFLFVMHPYDVGDRCEIDGVQMVVEEMNILTTVFLRYDNQKIMYPNSVLATMPISNYYRSPDMGDAIDFCIHVSTPMEKIKLMKEKITRYIVNKDDHWYSDPMIVLRDVEDMNKLTVSVWLSHRMNFQDMGERWVRRALLVEEMIVVLRDLEIEYRMLPMDVNVRNMPAIASTRVPSNWNTAAN